MNFVIDTAFVLAVVAFIRARAPQLKGDFVLLIALIVALVAAFLPEAAGYFPEYQPVIEKAIYIFKLFLSAPGLWDAAAAMGSKIKNTPVG